jgi:trigger factor
MKTEAKVLDRCQVKLTVTLDAGEMKAVVKEVEKEFTRSVRLPGFRPGKVPVELIRKQFANEIKQETERAMFRNNIGAAVKQENLDEVGIAEVNDFVRNDEGGSFIAVVEVKPTFKLPTYKGLKIAPAETAVKDEEVANAMNRMRMGCATFADAKEGEKAAEGDFAQIDYAGTVGGKPIAEVAPEAKMVAAGKGFWTQIEEGRFLPEILDALKGMAVGESKDVKVVFDKEAAPDPLKGAKALYSVTLKAFRRRVLPTDAELLEKIKEESIEKLEAKIRETLEAQQASQEAVRRENEAVELLLKKCDFDVPGTQVRRAMDAYLQQFAQRAQQSGLDADYFEKNRDKIVKEAEEAAHRQVRLWYIIEAIAKAENIESSDEERGKKVIAFILENTKK